MPIQATLIPEPIVPEPIMVASSQTMPDEATPPMPPMQGEVMEKNKRKDKNTIAKRVKRKVGCSSGESSDQGKDSLDDQEVVQSLMEGSILLHIIDKMIQMENVERFDKSFAAYLELGHYLFAHSKVVDLCQAEASRTL
ncbi:hypothetical protein COCNU_scaffold001584G000010 [Cocos nucifera]|nr:hypothetical protein [Cocos nucifera]